MIAPISRIVLRYLAGFLVAKGLLDTNFGQDLATDPDVLELVTLGVGIVVSGVAEVWYTIARRLGWSK